MLDVGGVPARTVTSSAPSPSRTTRTTAGATVSEDYRRNYYRDRAELGLAYGNLPCIGAEVQLPFGGVKKSGNGYPSAREIIEAVTDRTA